MKFLSWLGLLFFIAVITASITAPGDKKFERYVYQNLGGDTMNCKPLIGKTTEVRILFRILSFHSVSYCEKGSTPLKLKTLKIATPASSDSTKASGMRLIVPKITRSERYLGLFGRFWKL